MSSEASPQTMRLLALLLSIVLPASGFGAQDPSQASSEATFIRLDVFATRGGVHVDDLTASDFEVVENGAVQDIATFERVAPLEARPAGTGPAARRHRRRVFIIFLDAPHLSKEATARLRETIVPKLDALIGPDDLLGIMTSEVSAGNLTLAPKTQPLNDVLEPYWQMAGEVDPEREHSDAQYLQCYPAATGEAMSQTAREMIERRRERVTVDVLIDLARHFSTARDERKAVILLSEGWMRHGPNPGLAGRGQSPTGPPMRVGSDGMPYALDPADPQSQARFRCDMDRLRLSQLDNARGFEALVNESNLGNVSFYAIDPDGPPAAAATTGAPLDAPRDVEAAESLASSKRSQSLVDLASDTDGMAAVDGTSVEALLARVAEDLAAYYLVGYFSSLQSREAEFRNVRVQCTRPDVVLRTRRGYRASSRRETVDVEPLVDEPETRGSDLEAVRKAPLPLGRLDRFRSDDVFRIAAVPTLGSEEGRRIWIVGELDYGAAQTMAWRSGAEATVIVTRSGEKVIEERVSVAAGERTFVTSLSAPTEPGGYLVQVRLAPGRQAKELSGADRFDVVPAGEEPAILSPLLFRRGPATGGRYLPTADVRFRRNEILRVAAPVAGNVSDADIRLLGRDSQAIDIPVAATIVHGAPDQDEDAPDRSDQGAWIVGRIPLAPLAPGEYVVEVTGVRDGEAHGVRVPFRLIP